MNPWQANRALNGAEVKAGRIRIDSTPLQINVELTGVCNVNPPCVFCSGKNVGYNYAPLDAAYLDRYASYLDRCERINDDSFGEPLSHPELLDLARRFTARGQHFSLVTNGLLLTHEKAEALAELGPKMGLHISFNAATERTFFLLTGKSYGLLVENVRFFVDAYRRRHGGASPDLALTFIVMRINRHEVSDFLHLASELGVRALLAPLHDRPSEPLGQFGYDFVYEREMLPFEELRAIGEEAQHVARRLGLTLLLQWDADADAALRSFAEAGVDIPCLIPWRYLHIQEHSRNVYACPYHKRPIGNLGTQSLEQIWNGDAALDLRRSLAGGEIPRFCWNNSAACPLIYKARHDGFTDPLTGNITMGENDHSHLNDGWHPLEELPERVRWTSPRAAFRIAVAEGQTTLCVRCRSLKPRLEADPARGFVEFSGTRAPIRLSHNGWHELRFLLPPEAESDREAGRVLAAAIVTDNPWVPARTLQSSVCEPVIGMPRAVVGSLDTRALGLMVQRIWVE